MKFSNILVPLALVYKASGLKFINHGNFGNVFTPHVMKKREINENKNSYTEILDNGAFHCIYHCLNDYSDSCDAYKKDLLYSFDTISNTFEFNEPVVFEAFVDDLSQYEMNVVAGAVMDTNFVSLRSSNDTSVPPFLYPQALARQLNLNKRPNYKKNDFIMALNNYGKFYDESKKNGFVLTIIHEIFHGLGFQTSVSLSDLSQEDNDDIFSDDNQSGVIVAKNTTDTSYIKVIPNILNNVDVDELSKITTKDEFSNYYKNIEIQQFSPLFIYDKYLVDSETKEKLFENTEYAYKEFNSCFDTLPIHYKDVTFKKLLECYNSMSFETKVKLDVLPMRNFLKMGATGFLTKDDTVVPLQTFNNVFMEGSSIHHTAMSLLDDAYNKNITYSRAEIITKDNVFDHVDDDFLMYFGDIDLGELSFEEFQQALIENNKSLIGPGIVNILKTIGWTGKGEKFSDDFYYVDDEIDFPEQHSYEVVKRAFEFSAMDLKTTVDPSKNTTLPSEVIEATTSGTNVSDFETLKENTPDHDVSDVEDNSEEISANVQENDADSFSEDEE